MEKGYYLIIWYSRNSRCHWQTCHQEESDDACKCDKADRRNRDIMHRTMKFWNIHFSFQIWHLRIRWHLMVALRIITAFIYLLYRFSYQISIQFNKSWRNFQFTRLRKWGNLYWLIYELQYLEWCFGEFLSDIHEIKQISI